VIKRVIEGFSSLSPHVTHTRAIDSQSLLRISQ
jgi:hypothetical protein